MKQPFPKYLKTIKLQQIQNYDGIYVRRPYLPDGADVLQLWRTAAGNLKRS